MYFIFWYKKSTEITHFSMCTRNLYSMPPCAVLMCLAFLSFHPIHTTQAPDKPRRDSIYSTHY